MPPSYRLPMPPSPEALTGARAEHLLQPQVGPLPRGSHGRQGEHFLQPSVAGASTVPPRPQGGAPAAQGPPPPPRGPPPPAGPAALLPTAGLLVVC